MFAGARLVSSKLHSDGVFFCLWKMDWDPNDDDHDTLYSNSVSAS